MSGTDVRVRGEGKNMRMPGPTTPHASVDPPGPISRSRTASTPLHSSTHQHQLSPRLQTRYDTSEHKSDLRRPPPPPYLMSKVIFLSLFLG